MRLDKYLKVSRLIKRRTVANEACDNRQRPGAARVLRCKGGRHHLHPLRPEDPDGGGGQRGGKRGQGRGGGHVPRSRAPAGQTVINPGVPSYDTVKTVWEGALF